MKAVQLQYSLMLVNYLEFRVISYIAVSVKLIIQFTSKDEHSLLKTFDFGLSDYVKPDERLNDIVGSAYYVAPEVLHRSYGTEADMWSIGVIAYILLYEIRPFWAHIESKIFRAVLKDDPNFDEAPWPCQPMRLTLSKGY
ncbi:hypothetical protein L1987_60118 [Smallanthus sonchifolius]|uniref:Uncharacterized protein n=1 Tax=Smallanthus sonchifolius TaxID=185202 RepID=A0ACB9D800_9ASTR|nr:hypothetical protein L1987_60118 [Smallanthus sonchifolius]